MFKNKGKMQNFVKRQIAKVLAVVMAFSSFASTGLALSFVHAADEPINDHAQSFIQELVKITADGTKYEWGGWLNPNVDCRGFVRAALSKAYGLDIQFTAGYLVDENGNAINKNGKIVTKESDRVYIDVAAYDAVSSWKNYVGQRICVEGNGKRTYYRVAVADVIGNLKNGGGNRWSGLEGNVLDVSFNGHKYSSMIAYACRFPGSIIRHNGHYGVGLGEYHGKADILEDYSDLNGTCSGTEKGDIIRWSDSAYKLGNSYDNEDPRYWFGKTVFLSACSKRSGIRADNFTTTGKSTTPANDSHMAILICESEVETSKITFKKVDQATGETLAGAKYGIYTNADCTKLKTTFTSTNTSVTLELERDVYYVKEITAPTGYELSTEVVPVDATKYDEVSVTLYDKATHGTVFVKKVDANDDGIVLKGTKLWIQEYNKDKKAYENLVQLTYSNITQAFSISSTYTNNEGVEYADNTLHYSNTNLGKFKLVETESQKGYINSGFSKEFNIKDGNLRLAGDTAVTNVANLSLLIKKINIYEEPIAGVKFVFEYNGVQYKGKTNSKGQILFENIPEGPLSTGILYETYAPDGYVIPTNYVNGQPISLNKDKVVDDCYQTTVTIMNSTQKEPPPESAEGEIILQKIDMSRVDNFKVPVPGALYTVYTDEALTNVATDMYGFELKDLETSDDGYIYIRHLELGIYYIKETKAPDGYAIQTKTFAVNLLEDYAEHEGTVFVTVKGVGDPKQLVTLGMQKVDSVSKRPIPNAVYALYAASDLITATHATTIKSGTLLGYYKTDSNGMIEVDRFGTDSFVANGVTYKAVDVVSVEGTKANQSPLVNGQYYFVEVAAPYGYVLNDTKITFDASYQANFTKNDLKVQGGVVSPAGRILDMNRVVVQENRQTVSVKFNKYDWETNNNTAASHYNLSNYSDAVKNHMAATLEGAKYQMINTVDIIDINTGNTIPANTVIGIYTTDSNGEFIATKMTEGAYNEHAIPNGKYKFIEVEAPQGYSINTDEILFDASWTVEKNDVAQIQRFVNAKDQILKQAITIKKVSDSNEPMSGVSFQIYSVAEILESCNLSTSELPWNKSAQKANGYYPINRDEFAKLIQTGKFNAVADSNGKTTFTTDSNGIVHTGDFVYGDYIVYETAAPQWYNGSDAIYVQIPWVLVEIADATFFVHDVYDQPTENLEQTVVNTFIKPDTTNVTVNKIWADNDNQYGLRPESIQVQLFANGKAYGDPVTLNESNRWSYTWSGLMAYAENRVDAIVYTVDEVLVPEYYAKSINGTTITNTCTYVPSKTEFTVNKVWIDNDDQYGLRPDSIQVQLFADGQAYGDPVTLNAINGWRHTWTNLPQYSDIETTEIEYVVREVKVPAHYESTVSGGTITNTCIYVPEKTDFTVNKVWIDNNDEFGLRPNSIQVQLFADGKAYGDPVTLSASNNWTYTWSDLVKHSDAGVTEIEYIVHEVKVPDHYEMTLNGGTITNTCTYVPEKTDFTVNKVWVDNNDQYGLRPDNIQVQLFANGKAYGDPVTLSELNGWTYTWKDLMRYSDAGITEIEYVVHEVKVPDHYEMTLNGGTITNTCTYVPEKIDFTVNKVWNDNNDKYGLRPNSIQVQLFADGKAYGDPITLSAASGWTYTWTDLMRHSDIGVTEIEYVVHEVKVPEHYEMTLNGGTITNTCTYVPEKIDFTVNKVWNDNNDKYGLRPNTISVQLYADGVPFGGIITLTKHNDWTYTWTDLMKHSDIGVTEIIYTVDEVIIPNHYEKHVNGGTITNTCTYVPEKTDFTVNKVWIDNNDEFGLRPDSIQVQLFADGKAHGDPITLSDLNNWTYTWTDLLKHSDIGITEIEYIAHEVRVPDYYEMTLSGGTITNTCTYVPEKTDFTVNKVWVDNDDQYGLRPNGIQVQLFADGKAYGDPITLTESNGWTYTWSDLIKSEVNGKVIVYTVDEIVVPEHYENSINGDTITNTCTYVPEKVDFTVNKVWVDNDDEYGLRPESIQVQLFADGKAHGDPITLSATNGWTYTWTALMKHSDIGVTEIEYVVHEVKVPEHYEMTINGGTITNTCTYVPTKTDFTVNKVWVDNDDKYGLRPNSIQVQLFADGKAYGDPITLSSANNWTYTWTDLMKHSDAGITEIEYVAHEVKVPEHYEMTLNGGTITNTCTYVPEKTDFTVNKVWIDNNDQYGLRPESIQVQLFADGKAYGDPVVLSASNGWTYTWHDLMKYSDIGITEIEYVVHEIKVPEHYEMTLNGGTITNTCTYVPEKIDFTVNKVWNDNNDQYGLRPNTISVQLYADGEPVGGIVTLTATSGWTYTWTDLMKHSDIGVTEIEYTVKEVIRPMHYSISIDGGTITNTCTYVPEKIDFTVNKVWVDNDNEFGFRPNEISVQLYANGIPYGDVVVITANDNWTYTWTDLMKHSDAGITEIKYTVDEVDVPPLYEKSINGNVITNTCTYVKTSVIISKYEVFVEDKNAVAGATLQILDANGQVVVLRDGTVCEWITGKHDNAVNEFGVSGYLIEHLPAGTYVLHEAVAPDGYATAEDVVFTVKETSDIQYVHMVEQPIIVQFDKLDAENDEHIYGAEMIILDENKEPVLDKNGNPIPWVTDEYGFVVKYLAVGTYYLRELKAPVGYQKADDVKFDVLNTAEIQVVTMYDKRTVGTLQINKVDSITKLPLANVVFDVVSVDDVIDPITGEVIFSANQIVETVITNENGFAQMSNHVPIGTYGEGGFKDYIKYNLVEIKAANGQYDKGGVNRVFEFKYINDTTPIVELIYEIENSKPELVVNKTGTTTTFVGDCNDKHNVTVVKNGDMITYTITVENTGLATAWNIVIRDGVPTNTTFVEMDTGHHGVYDANKNCVYWVIDELKAGETIALTFTVNANSDVACEIVNIAQYAMPAIIPEKAEDFLDPSNDANAWIDTNAVVHQIVAISKDASVEHGTDELDSVHLGVGTTFTYTITFNCTNPVYGFTMCDPIPNGLSFVSGTAKYQLPGSDVVIVDNIIVGDDNVIAFPTLEELPAGVTTFSFDVIVNEVEKYNKTYQFVNQAMAIMQSAKCSDTMVELKTNTVSNKTFVQNPGEDIPQTGDDMRIVTCSIIAFISAIAMIALGIYGYRDEKKSKR